MTDDDTSGFDKLEQAEDHEDRAERLREEACNQVAEKVENGLPFDADVSVENTDNDSFGVEIRPKGLREGVLKEFDEETTVTAPVQRLIIGHGDDLLVSPSEMKMAFDGTADGTKQDAVGSIKDLIREIETHFDDGAPIDEVLDHAVSFGMERSKAEHEIEKLRRQGDVYEPSQDHLRTV
jgi:hypothetical protein